MRQTADVVIIGGGVMGCSILYHLARLGVTNSLLLEMDTLGSGSTGRSQAICRMHYSNPETASMAWESLKVFSNFDDAVGSSSGFVKTGYLVVVEDVDRPGLERNVAMQQGLGIDTGLVTADDVKELAPMLVIDQGEATAWEPESGYADPHQVTTSYAARAREMGAEIQLRTPALGIELTGGRVGAVSTRQGRVETPTVVMAAGPWSKRELAKIGVDVPLIPVRHQIATLGRPVERLPGHPTVGDIARSFSFRPDGTSMTLVGFGEEEVPDIDVYDQGVDMARLPDILGSLAERMPAMAEAGFMGGWSGLFTTTPDWHPILDRAPGIEGLYCAVGFSGHGFKLSPMIGTVMAELIVQGQATSLDISRLGFDRFDRGDLISSSYRYRVLA